MTWLHKLFTRDRDQDARISAAQEQQVDAAKELAAAREVGRRNRRHLAQNHFSERMAAALEPRGYAR